ncbi:MAG: YggT family protein [Mariprofundaceae bacterium]|nr:YggT family protein [Mariprofundaceae bacterium]
MFVLGYFLEAIATVIEMVTMLITWIVVARAVISWVSADPNNPIVRAIYQITEPILFPIRSRLPYLGGMDLSPIVVIIIMLFLGSFLGDVLHEFAQRMT